MMNSHAMTTVATIAEILAVCRPCRADPAPAIHYAAECRLPQHVRPVTLAGKLEKPSRARLSPAFRASDA
jgi:hypothetical protein